MRAEQRRRLYGVLAILLGVGGAVALALQAFNANLMYYYTPSELVAGKAPTGALLRLGGMVVPGSIHREAGTLAVHFTLTDFAREVSVDYTGVLPDLFRAGQGVVARGRFGTDGRFRAEEVLARHDENYTPPEVADSLRRSTTKPSQSPH